MFWFRTSFLAGLLLRQAAGFAKLTDADTGRAQRSVAENFGAYAGETLHFPDDAAPPELAFLSQHRATIFRKS